MYDKQCWTARSGVRQVHHTMALRYGWVDIDIDDWYLVAPIYCISISNYQRRNSA